MEEVPPGTWQVIPSPFIAPLLKWLTPMVDAVESAPWMARIAHSARKPLKKLLFEVLIINDLVRKGGRECGVWFIRA